DRGQVQVRQRRDRRAAPLAVEQRHLAEVVARSEDAPAAVRGADLGLAVEDDHEAHSLLAADRDLRALGVSDLPHLLGEPPQVAVEVDGGKRSTMQAGGFFGEISMLDRGPATATVVTRTPARLMVMSHSQFRDVVKGSDDLLSRVMTAMGERLRADSLARQAA